MEGPDIIRTAVGGAPGWMVSGPSNGIDPPTGRISSTGGFHNTNRFGPRGDPSSFTSSIVPPMTRAAWSTGLAIVAEQQMKTGDAP